MTRLFNIVILQQKLNTTQSVFIFNLKMLSACKPSGMVTITKRGIKTKHQYVSLNIQHLVMLFAILDGSHYEESQKWLPWLKD